MGEFAPLVFFFEETGDDWSFMPLAARRALDRGGFRLSLEGWQSLGMDDRRRLVAAGADDDVDAALVERVVERSAVPASRIKPVDDPSPSTPPEQIAERVEAGRVVDAAAWSQLRALDRYALVHVMRRSIAHDDPSRLDRAIAAIVPVGTAPRGRLPTPPLSAAFVAPSASTRPSSAPPPAATPEPHPVRTASSARIPRVGTPPRQPSTAEMQAVGPSSVLPPASVRPPPPAVVSTHVDENGRAQMVDVGEKAVTHRRATATGTVKMRSETAHLVAKNEIPKGEVLSTARVAAIQAAKRASELIPLCHPVAVTKIEVHLDVEASAGRIHVTAVVEAHDRTGVEMEALTAVSVGCLTVYDMLKGIDRDIVIGELRLLSKSGGRNGPYTRVGG